MKSADFLFVSNILCNSAENRSNLVRTCYEHTHVDKCDSDNKNSVCEFLFVKIFTKKKETLFESENISCKIIKNSRWKFATEWNNGKIHLKRTWEVLSFVMVDDSSLSTRSLRLFVFYSIAYSQNSCAITQLINIFYLLISWKFNCNYRERNIY